MKRINLVCLIDDDPTYTFITQKIFEYTDFCKDVRIYHSGQEALDNLKTNISTGENIPEVIFLDLNMPVMDGWEFLDEFIKVQAAKKISIYVVTSSVDPEDIARVKQYEVIKNYLIKPITEASLKIVRDDFDIS